MDTIITITVNEKPVAFSNITLVTSEKETPDLTGLELIGQGDKGSLVFGKKVETIRKERSSV